MVGATGTGKSTSLAAMIGYRNRHSKGHILTIEDPIEFVHEHRKSIVTQREVGIDTESFDTAIKSALRQAPDVILLDEPVAGLTDEETARTADLIKSLAGDHTVVVIEHDMEFIRDLGAPVTVLHQGQLLTQGMIDEVKADPRVIEVYLGQSEDH